MSERNFDKFDKSKLFCRNFAGRHFAILLNQKAATFVKIFLIKITGYFICQIFPPLNIYMRNMISCPVYNGQLTSYNYLAKCRKIIVYIAMYLSMYMHTQLKICSWLYCIANQLCFVSIKQISVNGCIQVSLLEWHLEQL